MKKLINYIIAFFKGLKKEIRQEIKPEIKPIQRSKEHKEYYDFLKRKQLKSIRNASKRYASTKGF